MTSIVTVTPNPAIDHTIFIPNFTAGKVNRVKDERMDVGGKGFNVASFLKDYGIDSVVATGFLGKENRDFFEGFLAERQIEADFVYLDGKTRTNIKIVDEEKQEITDINFPGLYCNRQSGDALKHMLEKLALTNQWFVLCGSLPPGLPDDYFARTVSMLKSMGKFVALDTSGQALKEAIEAKPDLIKPNISEFCEILGLQNPSFDEIVQGLMALASSGIKTVCLSAGERGALFAEDGKVILARPPKIDVLSTVGAGDAMVAGLIAGALSGQSLTERAKLSTAFSACALTKMGPGRTTRERVSSIMKHITIEEVRI